MHRFSQLNQQLGPPAKFTALWKVGICRLDPTSGSECRNHKRRSQSRIERHNSRYPRASSLVYERPWPIARTPMRTAVTVIQTVTFQGTSELQSSRTTSGEIITYVFTW